MYRMRFNLHLTHWSLLFITLISSCFLFYVVASENAKYATTKQSRDASVVSNAHSPLHLTSSKSSLLTAKNTPTLEAAAASVTAATAKPPATEPVDHTNLINNNENEGNKDKILLNYKKVKKLINQPSHTSSPSVQPSSDNIDIASDITQPSIVITADADISFSPSDSVSTSNGHTVKSDEIKSSDGLAVENSADNVENKNVFNTINTNANADVYADSDTQATDDASGYTEHDSSIEEATTSHILTQQQMPDVDQPTEQGIIEQHIPDDKADIKANDLPDITDIPTVTVTELPLEVLQQPQNTLNSVIIDDGGDISSEDRVNRTIEGIAENEEEIKKDEQIIKINDSGGGDDLSSVLNIAAKVTTATPIEDQEMLPSVKNIPTGISNNNNTHPAINASTEEEYQRNDSSSSSGGSSSSGSSSSSTGQVNLTASEEVPMPVFSEWAQKQMEEAEKQQALEQEQTVNNSAQRKNNTNGNGKPTALKIRAKNYASPDCGAKIISSSAYTSNAGAVLSSSKDEYMLSLCGNRIWFVVELCEAIQAQKIDFANFELYSSSPQNFTVAVSKRFPTREWSNVGRFQAEDKRAVQSFDLHPHLFGKFVRVDINSHYSKEHFCTLSLFRVFGTSEFEAFETENHPNDDLDDFDDEYLLEQNTVKHAESNLFKSASDAVLSIVKKATEVLGKPSNNQNQTFKTQPQSIVCRTPIYGLFSCSECSSALVEKVNNILTCEFTQLNSLLNNRGIRNDVLNTQVCAKFYGIETKQILALQKDIKQSFYVNILPNAYLAALCQLLATPGTLNEESSNAFLDDTNNNEVNEMASNLTIDKKFGKEDLNLLDHPENKLIKSDLPPLTMESTKPSSSSNPADIVETTTEINLDDNQQLQRPLESEELLEATTLPSKITQKPNLPDTNIFNVPIDDLSSETEVPVTATDSSTTVENVEHTTTTPPTTTTTPTTPTPNIESVTSSPKSEEDSNSWDNIENLLTTVPSTNSASNTGISTGSVQHSQQKNSNGPQSESVFIRLSNRIKALERNMSLSGQYLEELSRRYKKQVEELQQTLTQQIQTVRTLEEQNQRHHELEQLYVLWNTQLRNELGDLTLQVHACIVVIIFVGAFVFLVLMAGILFYRSLRRETMEVLSLYDRSSKKKNDPTVALTSTQKKMNRRKSFEDFSDHQQCVKRHDQDDPSPGSSYKEKIRRPSEEAMLILKECKHQDTKTEELDKNDIIPNNTPSERQRKISVCYGSNNNINQSSSTGLPPVYPQKSQIKRKGEKHSWPNTGNAQLQAWQHLVELNNDGHIGDSAKISLLRGKKTSVLNGKSKKKKDSQTYKRQQSSPAESSTLVNSSAPAELKGAEYDERLILDEDDLDNFIPNTDLAYNEFMPDGPRGYLCVNLNSNANNPATKKLSSKQLDNNSKKSRRLSSPVFFKSPFTKSLKGKITNSKSNPAHESTSWEWYRLKKSASSASSGGGGDQNTTTTNSNSTNNTFLHVSPNASLDSSSLSEINFPTNSTENSFRILEEAILSSGESAITTATTASSNCKKSSSGSGGISSSSNSNRSSSSNSSTQSKKKNRSFNKIFRKVF